MDAAELMTALGRVAGKIATGATGLEDLRRLSGGASQETWGLRLASPTGPIDLILRRRPDGVTGSGNAVPLATEAALIRAAAATGAPVPSVPYVFEEADGVGEAYVMGKVEGETLGSRIVRNEAFATIRPGLAAQCGKVLAQIHAIPTEGLPDLAVSDALTELEKYEAVYRGCGAERPIIEAALVYLKSKAPALTQRVLVHGDFRNGNLMIHPEDGLRAVLDWELAHLGDPAEDLGWICVNSWRFGNHAKPVGGFGDYSQLLDAYAAAGGDEISLDRVQYWQMLGSMKWGIMCMTMYQSFATGADASVERAMIGRRTSETEIDLITLLEAAA